MPWRPPTMRTAIPQTAGTPALREAIVDWFARRHGVDGRHRERDADDRLERVHRPDADAARAAARATSSCSPTLAYPTYAVGAALVGATVLASDDPDDWPDETRLVWLNSPGNPDGRVHRRRVPAPRRRAVLAIWAR